VKRGLEQQRTALFQGGRDRFGDRWERDPDALVSSENDAISSTRPHPNWVGRLERA